jgi:hypothetical protein
MTKQLNGQTLSWLGRMRVSFARWLLRFARRLAYAIAPELKETDEKKDEERK